MDICRIVALAVLAGCCAYYLIPIIIDLVIYAKTPPKFEPFDEDDLN